MLCLSSRHSVRMELFVMFPDLSGLQCHQVDLGLAIFDLRIFRVLLF
jgi:hypothetical protein